MSRLWSISDTKPHFIALHQAESRLQTLSLELESLKADVVAAEEVLATAESGLREANEEESTKQIKVGEVKALFDEARSALGGFENQLARFSSELSEIKRQKASLAKQAEACILESKKLSVAISRIQKERQSAEKLVGSLLKNNAWIESEKSAFGVVGGDYDFEATDPYEMSQQVKALKAEQDSLVSWHVSPIIDSNVALLTHLVHRARKSTRRLWV
jgi:structural maintenance of chromosome 2